MEDSILPLLIFLGAAAGAIGGLFAYPWKRRNSGAWMLYGAVTFGAALILLALLPRLERRSPPIQHLRNWHQ